MDIAAHLITRLPLAVLLTLMAWSVAVPAAELGLPEVTHPAHNPATPAKIALGQQLFHDPRLSADGSVSCATCHVPEQAFTDGLSVAEGIGGQRGTRNTPTLLNVTFERSFFWDGRRATLEAQAQDPFIHPREHGLKDHAQLTAIIRRDPAYRRAFKHAFSIRPAAISVAHVAQAIASFERTLVAANSAFDRYYYGGEKQALSASALRGLEIFQHRAQCTQCHVIGETSALLTDHQYHSLGVGYHKIEPRLAELTLRLAQRPVPALDHSILGEAEIAELGRFAVTLNPQDIAKFRTPSLRNVALTAPYMHDGSVATLEEVIDLELYYRGVASGRPLVLTPQEKSDLLAFLKALTGATAQTWVKRR